LTVNEVLDWYEANEVREFAPVALKERQRIWGLFRIRLGEHHTADCRPAELLSFLASQKGARSNWTRRRFKATICRPFNYAAEVGLIPKNPFAGVKIPEGPDGRDWTPDEYQAILRNSSPYFRRLIILLRFGGARPGEARTLQWSHVFAELRAIVQAEHKTAYATKQPRRIHFNRVLVKLLTWIRRNKTHATYVFANGRGRPWTICALVNHFNLIRQRAGLPGDVKLHGGRHTFATSAILHGVDVAILAELLGHRSIKTTQRYLHLTHKREHLNAAMERAIGCSPGGYS
jgi:integrase